MLIALDADGTIWEEQLDEDCLGKGQLERATDPIENNFEHVDYSLIRDRANHENYIRLHDGISDVIRDILKNGALLAIVSRNTSKAM